MIKTKSAGGVVINPKGQVLVVSQHGTSWSLPKGHIEKGEDILDAAKREIAEETGVNNVELVKKLGTYSRYKIGKDGEEDISELKDITIFLFHAEDAKLKPIDPDNPEARWVDKHEVVGLLTHKKDQEFFQTVIDQLP